MLARFSRWLGRSAETELSWIDIQDLHCRAAAGEAVVIVDVRQPEEFTSPPGHLPGAVNVPLGTLNERAEDLASFRRPIVLVCKTDRRSARAASELLAKGIRDVHVLRGGTDGWHARGLPLK